MALKNFNKLTDSTVYERFLSKPDLSRPRRVSEVNRLDKLIKTPGFQALFKVNTGKKTEASSVDKIRSRKDKGSCCFVSQNRDSPVPESLTPSYSRIDYNEKIIKEEEKKLIQISKEMKEIFREGEVEWGKLDERIPARKRKSAFERVKNLKGLYKEKKEERLKSIKRQRILKNAYPEGVETKIYNWNDSFLSNDDRKQSNFYTALSKIFKTNLKLNSNEEPLFKIPSTQKTPNLPFTTFTTFSPQPKPLATKKHFPRQTHSHNIITNIIS